MSFIAKRERVFNEYHLLDLPSRNEGKLKAFASCTDARAWSHFCADKSDHLVEIIKRNNETCRPKYVPTDVIVNTLLGTKNAEINRLRRKIEEFQQLLTAYDHLDLSCDQKVEIANAHAAIKAANKELDDMCLDLDLSGYTEGIDSEAFATGKSRGDEVSRHKDFELETSRGTEWSFDKLSIANKENKGNQVEGLTCPCDVSTDAVDPRIDEMQEIIITKDAKMNAMRNTIAVMENDICEPYCIYAHIYTALEKIYGVLCQNEKYKTYLELLTSGKDTRNVDIKGKIFYKLKVFEKFCCALISPCSNDCSCYHAEIISRVETAFALRTDDSIKINIDTKRAHLVADIMGNEEMKELLNKKNSCEKIEDSAEDDIFENHCSSIDVENMYRLKDLQASYDDLLTCYDDLKFEKQCLSNKCRKYEELEKEFENLRNQLSSYNCLWNEKEYYKKRSEDLDLLKEKYLVLADETLNLETQLKALEEINNVKSATLDQLRNENSILEKKINTVSSVCEKEKHTLVCKLKDCECKMICQDEQIKSLTLQLNKFLENYHKDISDENRLDSGSLLDLIESQKEEIKNLKNALFYKDEEKQQLQLEYQEKLIIINNLRMEIEEWKHSCKNQTQRNNALEKLTQETQEELKKITDENRNLIQEVEIKNVAIDNLMNVVTNKSLEINKLANDIELQTKQNRQLQEINELWNDKINTFEKERKKALISLDLASRESNTLLENIYKSDNFNYKENTNYEKFNKNEPIDYAEISNKNKDVKQQLENVTKSNLVPLNEIKTFEVDNIEIYREGDDNNRYSGMQDHYINYEQKIKFHNPKKGIATDQAKTSTEEYEAKQQPGYQNKKKLAPLNESDTFQATDIDNLKEMYSENNDNYYLEINGSDLNYSPNIKTKNPKMGKVTEYAKTSDQKDYVNQQQLDNQSKSNTDLINEIYTFQINNTKNIKKILSESSIKYLEMKDAKNEILEIKSQELDELKDKLMTAEESYKHLLLENNNLVKQLEEKINRIDDATREIQELKEEKHRCLTQLNDAEGVKEYLSQLKHENKTMFEKKNNLENDLLLKNEEIKYMSDLVNKLKVGKQQFDTICIRLETLEQKTHNLSIAYDNLIFEKNNVMQEIKRQKDQLRFALDNLRIKTNESNKLINDLTISREEYVSAQNKIDSLESENKRNLKDMKAENDFLKQKLESYSNLECELDVIKKSYHQLKAEKEKLDQDLKLHLDILEKTKAENEELHHESNHLFEYNKDIENALIGARHEVQSQLALPSNSYINLKKEVEELKREKEANFKQIQQMTDKLYESEEQIANLTQDITERDVKISILENHVNKLSNEVRKLQGSLGSMIDLGEEMNVRNQEIDQSLKQIEAHHSKATHNMKIELAKLMNENVKLEDQLSATNVEIEMLTEKNDTRSSQEIRLHDEREKIVKNIKKLEIRCVGNSALFQNNSSINSILKSLENIGNHVEASNNSCQLVLNKADEAKKIIEKEKQKVIKEKDDALRDKMDIQNQLSKLKETLEQQRAKDEDVIRDLEAELLNQKILIEKINQSNQSYILKLEEELHSIQKLYQNALKDIKDLEAKSKITNETCAHSNNIIEKATNELEEKYKEIKFLQNIIKTLQTKEVGEFATQTNFQNNSKSIALQTDNIELHINAEDSSQETDKTIDVYGNRKSKVLLNVPPEDARGVKSSKKPSGLILEMPSSKLNEVQILTENVEPSIAFIKNAYSQYKMKKLSFRQTEQYSFSVISNDIISDSELLSVKEKLSPDTVNDSNWSKSEMSRKESFYKMNIVSNMQSSNSYSNSFYLSENDRSLSFPVSNVISSKSKNDKKFTDSNQKCAKSLVNLNASVNNTSKESIPVGIDSRVINKMENLNKPKMLLKQNLNLKDKSITKTISSEFLQPLYNEHNMKQNVTNSSEYDNKELLNLNNHLLQHSSSDTSLLKTRPHKDLEAVKKQKNDDNMRSLINSPKSRSLKSLISLSKFSQNDDSEDLNNFGSKNRIDYGDNNQRNNLLIDNTVYDMLSASKTNTSIVKKKSNENNKNNPNGLNHENISKHTKYSDISNNMEHLNGNMESLETINQSNISSNTSILYKHSNFFSKKSKSTSTINGSRGYNQVKRNNIGIMVQIDNIDTYKEQIKFLNSAIENMDRDYKEKISAIKAQYDNNIRNIMNEHNQGVQSLQGLHEETLQDILKVHENETDNLRSMSIEAMRNVDKLESENKILRSKILASNSGSLYEVPKRISSNEMKKRSTRSKANNDINTLTKTHVEEFNINPKTYGPCTCSLDINISDTIRNLFEQVDVDQRKLDEQAYIKHIANKMLTNSLEGLDIQELSFLHFKVCRTWKNMIRKGEALHKRIDTLENELINKQKQAQIHIAELDRRVAEERRRLQEVREAVCRESPPDSGPNISQASKTQAASIFERSLQRDLTLTHNVVAARKFDVAETPAGDLASGASFTEICCRRTATGRERRNVIQKLDGEERRDRKQYCDERPIRLRRSSDRPNSRSHKK